MHRSKSLSTCRICQKSIESTNNYYPFCSERCRLIDLGNWASESYVAHSPLTEVDEKFDSDYSATSPVDDNG